MDTLTAIKAHALSVRQIPLQTVHLYEMRHHKPGQETIEQELFPLQIPYEGYKARVSDPRNWRFDDAQRKVFRVYAREVKTPKNAGHWMCRPVTDTSSRVEWLSKRDNLAPTLEASVALFLSKLTA